MIIWGRKGYQKVLGITHQVVECDHCNNQETWQVIEVGRKFTLYFIPLFRYGRKYYLACPICSTGLEIAKKELEHYLQ